MIKQKTFNNGVTVIFNNVRPVCEHCGKLLPYELEFDNDGVSWCDDCIECVGDGFTFTKKEWNFIYETQAKYKVKYYKEKLKRWKKELLKYNNTIDKKVKKILEKKEENKLISVYRNEFFIEKVKKIY